VKEESIDLGELKLEPLEPVEDSECSSKITFYSLSLVIFFHFSDTPIAETDTVLQHQEIKQEIETVVDKVKIESIDLGELKLEPLELVEECEYTLQKLLFY
jgi:hypothetical protein